MIFESKFLEWASLFSGKYFAMLAVYADETGTGGIPKTGEEPAPGVYGFITTPEKWDEFRIKWKSSLDQFKAPYFHFRLLHPNQRKKEKNPYHGWSNETVDDFIYEMAIVASLGPIPLGGNVAQKQITFRNSETKFSAAKVYRKMFYTFFGDFKHIMDDFFPKETDKASFFFSDNENENWIKILNEVIKDARHHNPLIGTYTPIDPYDLTNDRGLPCQTADLLAYVNRQNSSNMYEAGHVRNLRLLDFVVGRQILGRHWFMRPIVEMSETEWRALVADMRSQKKEFDLKNADKDKKDVFYSPISHHPFFKSIAKK